jgi:hypothetical protein
LSIKFKPIKFKTNLFSIVYFGLVHTKADSVFKGAQALLADDRLEAVGGSN